MSGEQWWMAVWMKEAFDFHNISFLLFKFFNISMGISIITLKKIQPQCSYLGMQQVSVTEKNTHIKIQILTSFSVSLFGPDFL